MKKVNLTLCETSIQDAELRDRAIAFVLARAITPERSVFVVDGPAGNLVNQADLLKIAQMAAEAGVKIVPFSSMIPDASSLRTLETFMPLLEPLNEVAGEKLTWLLFANAQNKGNFLHFDGEVSSLVRETFDVRDIEVGHRLDHVANLVKTYHILPHQTSLDDVEPDVDKRTEAAPALFRLRAEWREFCKAFKPVYDEIAGGADKILFLSANSKGGCGKTHISSLILSYALSVEPETTQIIAMDSDVDNGKVTSLSGYTRNIASKIEVLR